ncbi:hypothetical protein SAMN02745166_04207 [Prosthecobacter debontii]|uniref:Glycine zipper n=1 Tax=Prosthecobacter debontii TaxID=48467 RepID=A0A1T4YU83_9BACT|nr:hypothetical protein [Prosthecobacter debontii]SKB05223.1 hypothetical protein SAMN02745166_04207 [Prosthecobacter debontii]
MKQPLLPLLCLCLALASCANSDGTMNKGLLGAATGGLLGALVGDNLLKDDKNGSSSSSSGGSSGSGSSSNDDSFFDENTGLISGAVAGYAAGAISDSMAKNEVRQKYLDGYNKGRSDAIKELYWVKRDAERATEEAPVQRRYYEVPVPEHVTTDGVLVEPRKVVIEVVE